MDRLQKQLCAALKAQLRGGKARVPEAGHELLNAFLRLSEARTWHAAGPNPIAFAEIEAFIRLMRLPLQPHHVRIIRALDAVWTEDFYRKRETGPEGTKVLPPVSEHPISAALLDVMLS